MTHPAVHGQFQQDASHKTAQDAPLAAARTDARTDARTERRTPAQGPGPEDAPAPAARRAVTWRKAAVIAAAGIPVGLLWWLLAPSGLNLLSGNPELRGGGNTAGWLPRDLVLAGLFLLAGCISGAVASGSKHSEPSGRDVLLAVGAGAVGALAAWGTGVLCGLWWATPEDTSANASIAFSLRSLAVLAIWPAAAALTLFLNTVFATPKPGTNDRAAEPPSAQASE